ncbi:hypothetical protein IW262DRAFT_1460363 [Armillaria fumosa]|nr:hypothetical protein IW262DRAFT_1460363 [Armillaria fumosa]
MTHVWKLSKNKVNLHIALSSPRSGAWWLNCFNPIKTLLSLHSLCFIIKKSIAEYIPKTAYEKIWKHRKPASEDDAGLSTWVEKKVADLEKAFLEFYQVLELKKLENMRKKFAAKFCNAKNDKKKHLYKQFFNAYMALPFLPTSSNTCLSASLPGVPMAPTIDQADTSKFLLLNSISVPTGCDLFLAEQKEEINIAVHDE